MRTGKGSEKDMEIKLCDKWYLASETNCYALATAVKNGKNSITLNKQKYYSTLESALSGYIEIKIKESGAKSFTELKKDIEDIVEKIKNIKGFFKGIKIEIEIIN